MTLVQITMVSTGRSESTLVAVVKVSHAYSLHMHAGDV